MQDPVRALVYIIFLTTIVTIFGRLWVELGGISPKSAAKNLLDADVQVPGFRRSQGSVQTLLNKYIPSVTIAGGIIIGLLAAISDVLSVFGTGIGILLMVDILVNYYNLLIREQVDTHMPKLGHYLEEPRRITIVVGIPGVGKTTVITKTKDILLQSGYNTTVIVYGSVMLSEAKKMGIGDRDQIRKLSVSGQQNLQNLGADYICSVKEELVIVDTHLFIRTSSGFFPGIPQNVIQKLKPRNLILITATPEEILARRAKDESRNRDMVSIEEIKKELGLAISMISTISILSGSAFEIVDNHQGSSEDTASFIARILTKD